MACKRSWVRIPLAPLDINHAESNTSVTHVFYGAAVINNPEAYQLIRFTVEGDRNHEKKSNPKVS